MKRNTKRTPGLDRRQSSENQGAIANKSNPIQEAFEFLATCWYDKGCQIGDSEWKHQEYGFPFSTDETVVKLSNYYGDCHYMSLFREPKFLSYPPSSTPQEDGISCKIESLLRSMWKRGTSDCICRLEIDFVKLFLTCDATDTDSMTIAEMNRQRQEIRNGKSKISLSSIRTFLPAGVDTLIGILKDFGALLTKTEDKSDTLRCACFWTNFEHNNRSFESSLFVDPETLVFSDFQSIVYPGESVCLANPRLGETEGFGCDLRIKAKTKEEYTKEDFKEVCKNRGLTPPPTLTRPGLDGLFERKGDGYECKPDAHILDILEKTNRRVHHFQLEGFNVILSTSDGREFHVNKSGWNGLRYSYECWPKLLFILEDEDRIPNLIDLAHRLILHLFEVLADGRLETQPWRCFGTLGDGISVSASNIQLLRQINSNDNLEDMLGVKGRRALRFRAAEVLDEIKCLPRLDKLDPTKLRMKLINEAKKKGINLQVE